MADVTMSWARRSSPALVLLATTGVRIVLTPVIMALVLSDGRSAGQVADVAAILFCVTAATDIVDGWLARRWNLTSKVGSFLDTTADKLLVTGVLVALVSVGRASVWIAALIITREIVILALRGVVAADGDFIQPSRLGKAKALIQFLAIALAIARPGDPVAGLFADEWVMLAAAVITVASAADYLMRFASSLSRDR